jgi:hypothetical protein
MTTTAIEAPVWAQLSFPVYDCKVDRLGDKTGRLTVTLLGAGDAGVDHILHEETVSLSHGANGGAAEEDIIQWRKRCERVIDDPSQRSCGIYG